MLKHKITNFFQISFFFFNEILSFKLIKLTYFFFFLLTIINYYFFINISKTILLLKQSKGLDAEKLFVSHIQVNQAPKQRRRTYRAHGRSNKYESSPSHIELILTEREDAIEKASEQKTLRLTSRQRGRVASQKRISA